MGVLVKRLIRSCMALGLLLTILLGTMVTVAAQMEHHLDPLITEETVENDALWAAYQDFKRGIDQFTLHDKASTEVTGTSLSEVQGFEAAVEGSYFNLNETESYLSFMYTSETTVNVNDNLPVVAELVFFFIDEELYYTGIASLDLVINNEQLLPMERDQEWLDETNSLELMIEEQPRVFGLSQMVFDSEPYYQVLLPQGETTEEMFAQFMYIHQEDIIFGFRIELEEILGSPQGAMKDLFNDLAGLLSQ